MCQPIPEHDGWLHMTPDHTADDRQHLLKQKKKASPCCIWEGSTQQYCRCKTSPASRPCKNEGWKTPTTPLKRRTAGSKQQSSLSFAKQSAPKEECFETHSLSCQKDQFAQYCFKTIFIALFLPLYALVRHLCLLKWIYMLMVYALEKLCTLDRALVERESTPNASYAQT